MTTPTLLIDKICSAWHIRPADITRQSWRYCQPRYAYFWMMRKLYPDLTLVQIGELNGRNYTHAAVHCAINRHHDLISHDVEYLIRFREVSDFIFKKLAA